MRHDLVWVTDIRPVHLVRRFVIFSLLSTGSADAWLAKPPIFAERTLFSRFARGGG